MDRNVGLTGAAKEKVLSTGKALALEQEEERKAERNYQLDVEEREAKRKAKERGWEWNPYRGERAAEYKRGEQAQGYLQEYLESQPEYKRKKAREEAMAISLEDPILQKRYDLLKRRTTQDLISPDYMDRWEESAREGAEEQKAAILSRARAMGLNASQMEALNQSLQETDATFERQIQKLRFENRESAKEEFENFTLALQTEGANQIHAQQSLALQEERARSARSRTLWGSILGFAGGVIGGVAGFMATAGNPLGAVAGASTGSAALGALGRSV